MSSYETMSRHPITKKWQMAIWEDNFYALHHYGVNFGNGEIFDPETTKIETRDPTPEELDAASPHTVTIFTRNKKQIQEADKKAMEESEKQSRSSMVDFKNYWHEQAHMFKLEHSVEAAKQLDAFLDELIDATIERIRNQK